MTAEYKRRTFIGMAAAGVAAGLAPGIAATPPADVKIGLLMPLSGRYAESGASVLRGASMVIDEVNTANGIKSLGGARLKLVVADDGSEPAKASLDARRLMTEDKVSFIIGPYSTPEAEAFMPVADRYQVGGLGLQTTLVPKTPYFATLSITADGFGKGYAALVKWLREKGQKIDTIVLTYANNDYGQTVAKSAIAALQAQGVKVLDTIAVDQQAKDMTPVVLRVKSLKPDAVISVVYFEDGVLLHKARFNLGYDDPIWIGGSAGFTDDKLWGVLGDEVASRTLTHAFGLAFYSPDANLPGMRDAARRGLAAYPGKVIDQSFMFGAQAGILVARAVAAAGSADPERVNIALHALKFPAKAPEIVLPFIVGDLSFNRNGILEGTSPLFVQWHDGKKAIVFPEAVASAQPAFEKAR